MKAHPETQVGHIHLTVADLDRAMAFYCDMLGFEISARYGDSAVFLSAGGYHHHIGLNTWAGRGASPAPQGHTGTADHGVSEAIYLRDPDNNGVEIYADRPKKDWKVTNDGMVEMVTEPLDINDLLKELDK